MEKTILPKIIGIGLVIMLFVGCISVPSESTTPPTTQPSPTAAPPAFEVVDLRVAPESVTVGDAIIIPVDVQNKGDVSGKYTVSVTLGNKKMNQSIEIEGKGYRTVEFRETVGVEGNVEISAGNITRTIHVTAEPADPLTFQNPQRYRVTYIVTVYNEGFTLDELRVYQPRPIAWGGQRDITIETVDPPPTEEGTDPVFGNGIYYWQQSTPVSGESAQFILKFSFTAYETVTNIDPASVESYDTADPLYDLYTRSEQFIEAADQQIIATANQVAGEETNPYLVARKFYDYIIDTVQYERLGKGLFGAKECLTTGKGECSDYAALFVALCRAHGIPARPVVGYWAVSGIANTHAWAEFYLEPFGWIPVDPNIGQVEPANREYYFDNMDNNRVILNKGYNISLVPFAPNNYVAQFLQVPLWWFWGEGDTEKMRIERTAWIVESIS